jgi:hypothetical protein
VVGSGGGCRRLHNEELNNLYFPSNIIRGIKSRRMRWVRQVARIGKMRNEHETMIRKPEGTTQ